MSNNICDLLKLALRVLCPVSPLETTARSKELEVHSENDDHKKDDASSSLPPKDDNEVTKKDHKVHQSESSEDERLSDDSPDVAIDIEELVRQTGLKTSSCQTALNMPGNSPEASAIDCRSRYITENERSKEFVASPEAMFDILQDIGCLSLPHFIAFPTRIKPRNLLQFS